MKRHDQEFGIMTLEQQNVYTISNPFFVLWQTKMMMMSSVNK